MLWKFLAFNVSADSLHLFYSFFVSFFLIFLLLYLLRFLHHKNDFFFFFSFLMKDPCFWCFCRSDSLHLFFDFFALVFFIFLVLCLLHFSHHKSDFFWNLLWKFLAFNVSADSLHLFYSFFASVFFILVLLYLLRFLADKNDLLQCSLLHSFKSFWFSIFRAHLALSFHNIMFISFTTNLDFWSNFRSVFLICLCLWFHH